MKVLYIDCSMGAAGDMLSGALLDLMPEEDRAAFIEEFNSLGIPGVRMNAETSVKCGVKGTHVTVSVNGEDEGETIRGYVYADKHGQAHAHAHDHEHGQTQAYAHAHDHEHGHGHEHIHTHTNEHDQAHAHSHEHGQTHVNNGMSDIEDMVRSFPLISGKVKKDILDVYGIIADAESKVHGVPVTQIHFHEVGDLDAVADVTAVCMLMDRIAADRIVVSAVNTGSGHVHCAHGILPVPAPATAEILSGMPSFSNGIQSELCTPTGAALLKYFASEYSGMPEMLVKAVGHGMGTKDFGQANCVTLTLGSSLSDR